MDAMLGEGGVLVAEDADGIDLGPGEIGGEVATCP